jgi:predicted aspartyl protease
VSIFKVNLVACNPRQKAFVTMPVAALVDTSSDVTWLPGEALRSIGIKARSKRVLKTTRNEMVEREVAYAILRANGSETEEEVVLGEPGDVTLIGARTLEAFGVTMEDDTRFVSLTSMMAFRAKSVPDPLVRVA